MPENLDDFWRLEQLTELGQNKRADRLHIINRLDKLISLSGFFFLYFDLWNDNLGKKS